MFQSRKKANSYRNFGLLFIFSALVLFLIGFISTEIIDISLFIAVFLIAFVSLFISVFFFQNYETWRIGAEGEEKVAKYLSEINYSFHVIHDVVLPRVQGNIDHIVLGSNGVFIIETKNNKGYIMCNGDEWTVRKIGRRGTPYEGYIGSPSRQVKKKAVLLNRFIQNRLKMNSYINGLTVFANNNAKLKIINPTVIVLRPNEICDFIQNYRSKTFLSNMQLNRLEGLLNQYSCFA